MIEIMTSFLKVAPKRKKKKTQTARVSLSHIDPDSRYRPFIIIAGGLSRELKKNDFFLFSVLGNQMKCVNMLFVSV